MTDGKFLLLFLGDEPGWMRVVDRQIIARNPGFDALAFDPEADEPETVILVVPGSDVALHWVDIPAGLALAQIMAAARIMAREVSAEPVETAHIAIGGADDAGQRCLGIVARSKMDVWLAEAAGLGINPGNIVPESMLLAPPEAGVRVFRRAGMDVVRGRTRAFVAEPKIAALLIGEEASEPVSAEDFESELGQALADAPLNLRQGDYAKPRQWKLDKTYFQRVALLAAAILLVTLLIQVTMIARYSFAADALEREAVERARDAISGNIEIVDPEAQLRMRLAELGGGPGFGEQANAVFTAIRDTAGVELQSMTYDANDILQLTAGAPGQPELEALHQRMMAAGLIVTPGAVRDAGGLQIGEFTVSAR